MTSIELLIILFLLFMSVPDFCRWLGRPALIYPMFVLFGLAVNPLVRPEVSTMLQQAGQIGFLLLLFEVGLEIDLPQPRDLLRPASYLVRWVLAQYPVTLALARFAGLPWLESFVAAAALTGCSVGMAHSAWRHYPGMAPATRTFVLRVMVLLEVLAVILLSAETAALGGANLWLLALKLLGIGLVIYGASRVAVPFRWLVERVLEKATHWRIHVVIVLLLVLCALGERLGLSGAKTAFFLGLFMSRVHHAGQDLEHYLAPISQRFLIPTFFVALGAQIPPALLLSRTAVLAAVAAALLIAYRELLHRRWLPSGGDARAYLLFSPNLTMVALAGSAMLQAGVATTLAGWIVLTGLFHTVIAILALPRPHPTPAPAAA